MEILSIVTNLSAHLDTIFSILFTIHAAAVAIVNLTPTPKDDEWVGKAYRVLEFLAGIFGYTAKEYPGERVIDSIREDTEEVVDDDEWSEWLK